MKTGIIIPCYNEEKRLPIADFKAVINEKNDLHLCFVNDGSKDDTVKVLQNLQQLNPSKVSIVDLVVNQGKASAVRAGAKHLYAKTEVDYIGFMDADLSTNFEDFSALVNTLDQNNHLGFVFGSRAKEASDNIQKDEFRAIISKLINILIVFILGLSIADTQCGAKVFRANLVPLFFGKAFKTKWLFDVEMFLRLIKYFGKAKTSEMILEQPLNQWIHVEDSKLGLKDSLEIPLRLLSIWVNYNWNNDAWTTQAEYFTIFEESATVQMPLTKVAA